MKKLPKLNAGTTFRAMPITLRRSAFGPYTLYTLGTPETYVSFVPERSAYVHQICIGGHELLWNYPDAEALTGNSGHRNLALLPFPNRLLEGAYSWEGGDYKFPVNKPDTRSALHGFGPHAPFRLNRVDHFAERAEVELTYLHRAAEHPASYPFDVRFDVVLSIDAAKQDVAWSLHATNLSGGPVPVGLGWHPYFLLPGGHEQWTLQMPPHQQVELAKAIPTGKMLPGLSAKPVAIDTAWDDCFKLSDSSDREVLIIGPAYTLSLKQAGDTRYTQLYVPPNKASVAIEPMSCGVNAFQVGREEVELAPKQSVSTSMQLSLQRQA